MNLTRLLKPAMIETEEQFQLLKFPLIAMPKFDGIRCALYKGKLLTNTLKEIPNKFITETLRPYTTGGQLFDGELILNNTKDYNKVQSAVMSREGEPREFCFMAFDRVMFDSVKMGYKNRLDWLYSYVHSVITLPYFRVAPYDIVNSIEDIIIYEQRILEDGYEGIILRSLNGIYKQGRSTFKEGICYKFKRTEDAEAVILDCIELEHNLNDAETDERGLTKRSSHAVNKHGSGMLGSFKVKGINGRYKDKIFYVSAGSMTQEERAKCWYNRLSLVSKLSYTAYEEIPPPFLLDKPVTITYKFDKTRGTSDAPSSPRFKAFRNDME
jgi:DNA ligase 1